MRDKSPAINEYRKKRRIRRLIGLLVFLVLLGAAAFGVMRFLEEHRIDPSKIYVEGNRHYTARQICDIVMDGPFGDDSFVLSHKYKDKKLTDVPFVDSITVTVLSADSVRITVFEKALAGYVNYLDRYVYFDKDGTVVESSYVKTAGIPQVTGLVFYSVEIGKPLTSEKEIFTRTLNLTKLMDKYGLAVDRIHFHEGGKVTLYFGGARVALGSEADRLEDKIMLLPKFLESVGDKTGVLDMEVFNEDGMYIFTPEG